jgi:hypothetical protein
MKINSITLVDSSTIPRIQARNTQRAKETAEILVQLAKAPAGKAVAIDASDVKKYERYSMQKALQKAGAHAIVTSGINPANGKLSLFVNRLTDAEWKDWLKS